LLIPALALCGEVLRAEDEIRAWQHFLKQEHPWWVHSDAGMHKDCFEKWEHKDDFEFLYKYRPGLEFDTPHISEMIRKHGEPYWLTELKNYRESLNRNELKRVQRLIKGVF